MLEGRRTKDKAKAYFLALAFTTNCGSPPEHWTRKKRPRLPEVHEVRTPKQVLRCASSSRCLCRHRQPSSCRATCVQNWERAVAPALLHSRSPEDSPVIASVAHSNGEWQLDPSNSRLITSIPLWMPSSGASRKPCDVSTALGRVAVSQPSFRSDTACAGACVKLPAHRQ